MKFLIFQLFVCFFSTLFSQDIDVKESSKAIHRVMYKVEDRLSKKYRLTTSSDTISAPGGCVQGLGFSFKIVGPLKKNDLRRILVESGQEFLEIIYEDPKLQLFLEEGFDIKNIDLALFIVDSKGYDVNAPDIGTATLYRGKLTYFAIKEGDLQINTKPETETYEEATDLLRQDGS